MYSFRMLLPPGLKPTPTKKALYSHAASKPTWQVANEKKRDTSYVAHFHTSLAATHCGWLLHVLLYKKSTRRAKHAAMNEKISWLAG